MGNSYMMQQPGQMNGAGGARPMNQPPNVNVNVAGSVGPNTDQASMMLGNKIYPFMCPCGKGLERERDI